MIEKAIAMHRAGTAPANIGYRLGISADQVRKLLIEAGETVTPSIIHKFHPMWEMSDSDRRLAIAKRAANGARKALRAAR